MSLNIIQDHPDQLSKTLIDQLSLLVSHILRDYKKSDLEINLKLVSSDEMVSLNHFFYSHLECELLKEIADRSALQATDQDALE